MSAKDSTVMAKKAFKKISEEKRRRILDAAAAEFAALGFHKANINTIADRAGISIGAMYNYFKTKDDLFLSTVQDGMEMLKEGFDQVLEEPVSALEKLEKIFLGAVSLSRDKGDYIMLYQNLAGAGMDALAASAIPSMERTGAQAFHRIIAQGLDEGAFDPDLDRDMAAFALDNHFMIFLASMASTLHRIRLSEFLGVSADPTPEKLEATATRIVSYLRRCLSDRKI